MDSNKSQTPDVKVRLTSRRSSNQRTSTRIGSSFSPIADDSQSGQAQMTTPYSTEAEQSILGAMMMEKGAIKYARQALTENDFYKEGHRKIFGALLSLFDKSEPADLITVVEELRRHNKLDEINGEYNGPAYLTHLIESCPTAANAPAYAAIVRDLSLKRRAAVLANQAHGYALNGVAAGVSIQELERTIRPLAKVCLTVSYAIY